MIKPIYLDYNGTTPHAPEVINAMRPFLESEYGNPSSSHWYGITPKKAVEQARHQVAGLMNCLAEEVIFTSGGTESNNHAIKGAARALKAKGHHIVTSTIEHPAVLEVCRYLEQEGFETTYVNCDSQGIVNPDSVAQALRPDTVLVSIMLANNEVGTIQPVAEIARMARQRGIVMHTDAAQALGKIPVDVNALDVDMLSLAGHKLYAPKGVGALYIKKGVAPEKFCHGAGQEKGLRSGTENVLEIVGLGTACEVAGKTLLENMSSIKTLRDRLHRGILSRTDQVQVNGHLEQRLPNTLSLSFKDLEANHLLEEIGLEVAASAGAACHSGTVTLSHVLEAMEIPEKWAKGTLRFSLGRMTTADEIEQTIHIVTTAAEKLRYTPIS